MQILRRALKNSRGLTLVEVLIAMVVFLLVSLAMMQTALVGIDSNTRNILRDEAASVAAEKMDWARNLSFDNLGLVSDPNPDVRRKVRNFKDPTDPAKDIRFSTNTVITELDGDNDFGTFDANTKQINITVMWDWPIGNTYTHRISTIRKK